MAFYTNGEDIKKIFEPSLGCKAYMKCSLLEMKLTK
jgi:hypothetical protein